MDKTRLSYWFAMKLVVLVAGLILAATWIVTPLFASGRVAGTYSIADRATSTHGGGPLFADGTMGGKVTTLFFEDTILQLEPTTWQFLSDVNLVEIRYDVRVIQGDPDVVNQLPPGPPGTCAGVQPGEFCDAAPPTGTPLKIDFDGDGQFDLLIRVTLHQ